MNKDEFVERLAARGYTKKDANIIIDDFVNTLFDALVEDNTVAFKKLGVFSVREAKPKRCVDIQTHKEFVVPGHKAVKFSPSTTLKAAVREGFVREE